jgi:uncharacterized protein YraI
MTPIMNRVTMTRAFLPAALISVAMLSSAQAQTPAIAIANTDVNMRSGPGPEYPVIGMIRDGRRANVLGCIEGSRWCRVDFRGRLGWAYSQYMTLSGPVALLPAPEVEVDVTQRTVYAAPPATYAAPPATYAAPAPMVTYQTAPAVTYQTAPAVTYQPPVTYQTPAPVVTYQPPVVSYRTAPAVTYQGPAPSVTYRAPGTTTVVETTATAPRDFAGRLIPPRETIYAATTPPRAYVPPRTVRTYISTNALDPIYLEGSLQVGAGIPDDIDLMPVPGSRFSYVYVNDYPVLVDPGTRRIVYVYR